MIDVHAHLFFEDLLGKAGPYGPNVLSASEGHALQTGASMWPLSSRTALEVEPAVRVAALDEARIQLQVVSISPLWLFHHAPHDIAESFAFRANNLLAQWSAETGGRARFVAQLPAQRPAAAAEELRRCVIEHGAVGAFLGSDARVFLDDGDLSEIYATCEDLNVPLFIHAAMPGIDGPAGDKRLDRWIGQAVLGYPLEDTVTTATFLLSDVLDRHPKLDVCLTHGGGATPMLWGRIAAFARTSRSPVTEDVLKRHMDRLWFDAHVHSSESARLLSQVANPAHLVFGSNFGGWDSENHESVDPGFVANAQKLLRLPD